MDVRWEWVTGRELTVVEQRKTGKDRDVKVDKTGRRGR